MAFSGAGATTPNTLSVEELLGEEAEASPGIANTLWRV